MQAAEIDRFSNKIRIILRELTSGYKAYLWLFFLIFITYFQSLFFTFSPLDDPGLIEQRLALLQNWDHLADIFTYRLEMANAALLYRPLLELSFMIDAWLGDGSPWMFHLSNVTYFFISIVIIFNFLILLGVHRTTSFICSLIILVHPINVSIAAWIPARNDSLLAITLIGSLIMYIKWMRDKKQEFLYFHYLLLLISLFVKENAVVIPLLVISYHTLVKQRNIKELSNTIIIWSLIIIFWVWMRHTPQPDITTIPFRENIIYNTLINFILYFGKFIFPNQLSVMPNIADTNLTAFTIVTVGFVAIIFLFKIRNISLAIWGILFFLLILFIPLLWGTIWGLSIPYEHRMFIPAIGIMILISQLEIPGYLKKMKPYFWILIVIYSVILGVKSYYRCKEFTNKDTFSYSAVNRSPSLWQAYALRADALSNQNLLVSAIRFYTTAMELIPTQDKHELLYARGNCYQRIGEIDLALLDYDRYMETHSDFMDVYYNKGIIYRDREEFISAINNFTAAIILDPHNALLYNERGFCYQQIKEYQHSLQDFNSGLLKDPENILLLNNRGVTYYMLGKYEDAWEDIKTIEFLGGSVHSEFKQAVKQKLR